MVRKWFGLTNQDETRASVSVGNAYAEESSQPQTNKNHPMKTDIEKRIKIKDRPSTAFKANCLMNDLFGVLAGIDDITASERADLLRQVAILADNYADDIEFYD